MDTVYLVCAGIGGAILVIQTLLLLIGMGGESDADGIDVDHGDMHDGDSSDAFFKFLSIKTLVAFLAFFGFAGLAGQNAEMTSSSVLLLAFGSGTVALLVVGYIMAGLSKLQSSGNVDLNNAVGIEGRVYLRVPGENQGQGKVTLEVQGRKIESKVLTGGPEIPTGAQVTVVGVPSPDTVEVQQVG